MVKVVCFVVRVLVVVESVTLMSILAVMPWPLICGWHVLGFRGVRSFGCVLQVR